MIAFNLRDLVILAHWEPKKSVLTRLAIYHLTGEAALSGTAAVLAGVGELIHKGETIKVGSGDIGPNTESLRKALVDIQLGKATDPFGWLERV